MKKDLFSALDSHELFVLRLIGEWLDLNLTGEIKRDCVRLLSQQMSQLDMKLELKLLPPEEAAALTELIDAQGRMPVAAFERLHGTVRQMGPGKMEREEPWLDPVSPAEALWYKGFIYRGFDEIKEDQIEEAYYIPEEFYAQIPSIGDAGTSGIQLLEPLDDSTIQEHRLMEALVDMVDDMTTMISVAQIKPLRQDKLNLFDSFLQQSNPQRLELLFTLAWELSLFRATDEGAKPARKSVEWLKQGREQQLRELADSWRECSWNELHNTPGLLCEGSGWTNDPVAARSAIIAALPDNLLWYGTSAFIRMIKENNPDFQRPGGNYDTWYIREHESGEYLRGFESWDDVEGRLLRFVIMGPLYWLGLVRLRETDDSTDISFQLTSRGLDWLNGRPVERDEITVPIVVGNDATLSVPINANQYHRFQIARVADLVSAEPNKPYEYWLTPSSLETAKEQGIEPSRLLEFLRGASGRPIPAGTKRAIDRWVEQGFEARIERAVILKVRDETILEKLRENPKTRPFIAETLGDLAAVIKPGDWQKFRQEAAGLGLLIDYSIKIDQG
jgi:hypothetical protein